MTATLCGQLIKQRNALFHRGAHIDEQIVYTKLFPIVTALAAKSEELVAPRSERNGPLDRSKTIQALYSKGVARLGDNHKIARPREVRRHA